MIGHWVKRLLGRLRDQRFAKGKTPTGLQVFKIVVAGPVGAGKTQYITSVADEVFHDQPSLGRLIITNAAVLYFFESPAAGNVDLISAIGKTQLLGVVLVIDCARLENFREAATRLDLLHREQTVPFVVVANHYPAQPPCDCHLEELRIIVRYYTATELVVCNVIDRPTAYAALRELLKFARPTPAAAPAEYQALGQLVETRAATAADYQALAQRVETRIETPLHTFDIAVVGHFHAGKTQYLHGVTGGVAGAGFLGRLTLNAMALHLIKWPSNMRFNFDAAFFDNRLLGVVLVIDCARPESFRYATSIMNFFRRAPVAPVVVVANHYPQPYRACHVAELRQIVRGYMGTELLVGNAADRRSTCGVLGELLAAAHQTPAALAMPEDYQALVQLVAARANATSQPASQSPC